MKQHSLALAVLAALSAVAVPAAAQSSVTIYGIVGLEAGKNPGSAAKVIQNGANSRLGFRVLEDLGGGLSSFVQIEHRIEPDTGAQSDSGRFWNGRSIVGLQGGFGRVWLGREYTPLFLNVALVGDPWGFTGIGALDSGLAGIGAYSRYDNTLNYQFSASGLTTWVQVAESDNNGNSAGTATAAERPVSVAISYANGPMYLAGGYDSRINARDTLWTMVGTYDFGPVKLFATFARGQTSTAAKHREFAFAATAPLGGGQVRAGIDQIKRTSAPSATLKQQVTLGYHYPLSKRTTIFADYVNDSKVARSKTGYGFGLKHAF